MTKKISLVHTADLHLGTSFSNLPDKSDLLQREQMQLFLRIIDFCRQNSTDILLIAGDLFEQPVPTQDIAGSVRDACKLIPETRIFITPGNHDPVCPDSPWIRLSWPDNVHIFRSGLEKIEILELGACIYGAAFCSTAAVRSLIADTDLHLNARQINILLLHGELVGAGQSSVYNPVNRNWLAESGFDYVALGHIHQGHIKPESLSSTTVFTYSGCPGGRGFDESGDKGIIAGNLIRVEQPGLSGRGFRVDHDLRQVNISGRRYRTVDVDISSCQDQDEIFSAIREKLQATGPDWSEDLYKISLGGAVETENQPAIAVLQDRLSREVFFCKLINNTTRKYNLPALVSEHSLMGAFVRTVLAEDKPDWKNLSPEKTSILLTGLQAFEGEVAYREAE